MNSHALGLFAYSLIIIIIIHIHALVTADVLKHSDTSC